MAEFCFFSFKTWWAIIIISQLVILVIMITSLSLSDWVSSSNTLILLNPKGVNKNKYFKGSEFRGSISFCYDGCFGTYTLLHNTWCDSYKNLDSSEYKYNKDEYDSVCTMFTNLYHAMLSYILIEVFTIGCLIIWLVSILCLLNSRKNLLLSLIVPGFVFVGHSSAFFLFFYLSNIEFDDNCDKVTGNANPPVLCMETGPKLSFFLCFFIFFVVFFYFVLARKYKKSIHAGMELPPIFINENEHHAIILEPGLDYSNMKSNKNSINNNMSEENGDLSPVNYPPAIIAIRERNE